MIISLKNVNKIFSNDGKLNHVLKNVNLEVAAGEMVVIRGASGSGKTTLLNIIGGLESVSNGEISVSNHQLEMLTLQDLTKYRARHIGFIYQFYNLIPTLTVLENILSGLEAVRPVNQKDIDLAIDYLDSINLKSHQDYFPSRLSGGQQQRVAILRALIKQPSVILADEPTGSLDDENTSLVIKLIQTVRHEFNTAVIVVTHNLQSFEKANSFYDMKLGYLAKSSNHG